MNIQKILIFIIAIVVLTGLFFVFNKPESNGLLTVKDFLTCETAGYPIMESYPRQCRTPEGTLYVEEIIEPIATTTPVETATTTPISTSTTPIATTTPPTLSACVISGCSGQVCSDKDMVTTCEYKEVYSCYETAVCERQVTGQCGWTETEELTSCIEEKSEEDNTL